MISVTLALETGSLTIPGGITDLKSFRRWYHSDDFPEFGRISFLKGEILVDLSREQFFTHNQIRSEFTVVLGNLVRRELGGRYWTSGFPLCNTEADFSTKTDGLFFSCDALETGRVRLIDHSKGDYDELEGRPDMVLEIVGDSTVKKDKVTLKSLYWDAGIPEYWLADVRGDRLEFDIYRRGPQGYVAVNRQGGWLKSSVFGRSFRLTSALDRHGHPDYTLEVR